MFGETGKSFRIMQNVSQKHIDFGDVLLQHGTKQCDLLWSRCSFRFANRVKFPGSQSE